MGINYRRRDRDQPKGWVCGSCDRLHEGLVMVFGPNEPLAWVQASDEERAAGYFDGDFCDVSVGGERGFYIRGNIELPVVDAPGEVFKWMVWSSLSEDSARLLMEHWNDPDRVNLEPRFGWLVTALPYEERTVGLPTLVHQRPVGTVPYMLLDHSMDHPLVAHQHGGITMHEIAALNERLLG